MRPIKKRRYQLQIPQPCQQNWHEMTPTEQGKFCAKCNTQIIDFTQLSTEEVLAILREQWKPVCGRLTTNQLETPIEVNVTNNHSSTFKWLTRFLFVVASKLTAYAATAHFSKPLLNWYAPNTITNNDTLPTNQKPVKTNEPAWQKSKANSSKKTKHSKKNNDKHNTNINNYVRLKTPSELNIEPVNMDASTTEFEPKVVTNPPFHSKPMPYGSENVQQTISHGRVMGIPLMPKKPRRKKRI